MYACVVCTSDVKITVAGRLPASALDGCILARIGALASSAHEIICKKCAKVTLQ